MAAGSSKVVSTRLILANQKTDANLPRVVALYMSGGLEQRLDML